MREIEAISGVFTNDKRDKVLLLRRSLNRTYDPTKWDLMGGDIMPNETPYHALIRDALEKLNLPFCMVMDTKRVTTEVVDAYITRYVFICLSDYRGLSVNLRKYDEFTWATALGTKTFELTDHARTVLKAIGFTR